MPDAEHSDNPLLSDPVHLLTAHFFYRELPAIQEGIVLEIGSRARSGNTRRELIPEKLDYVGFDIVEGPNVDVVGDVHKLSSFFEPGSISAIYSNSVFEHLAMPWKAVLEMNQVLQEGAVMFHASHQCWPIHEAPWDFWRFSNATWKTLFNRKTCFKLSSVKMGEPAKLQPDYRHPGLGDIESSPCYLISAVLCRKVSNTTLAWDMDLSDIEDHPYPH